MIENADTKPTKAELDDLFARIKRAEQREREADDLDLLATWADDEDNAPKAKRLRAQAKKLRARGAPVMVAASAVAPSTKRAKRTKKLSPSARRALILRALAAAIREAREVVKAGRNALGSYDYARAEDMIREARNLLARHLLTVLLLDTVQRVDEAGDRVLVARWSLVHDEYGEIELGRREWPLVDDGRDVGKAWAAADTSALAYFLRDLLQLERTERGGQVDDDAKNENLMTIPALRDRIAGIFDERGVPVDERDAETLRLLGHTPATLADFLHLLKALQFTEGEG